MPKTRSQQARELYLRMKTNPGAYSCECSRPGVQVQGTDVVCAVCKRLTSMIDEFHDPIAIGTSSNKRRVDRHKRTRPEIGAFDPTVHGMRVL